MAIIIRGMSDKDLSVFLNKIIKKPEKLKEFIDKKADLESKKAAESVTLDKTKTPLSETKVLAETTLVFEKCFINLIPSTKKISCFSSKTQGINTGSMVMIIELLKKYPFTQLQFNDCIFNDHYLRDFSIPAFKFLAAHLKTSQIDTLTILDPNTRICKRSTLEFAEHIQSNTKLRMLTYDAGTHATIALCQAIRNMSADLKFINPRMAAPERFHTTDVMKIRERREWYNNRYNRDWDGTMFEVEESYVSDHYKADADISDNKESQTGSQSLYFEYKAFGLPGSPIADQERSQSDITEISPVSSAVRPSKPLRIEVPA